VTELEDTPNLRWFERINMNCQQCGKRAAGRLRGSRNEDYGLHCQKCADKRLAASKRVREQLEREDPR
jgi:DNA-directed RNA polymerase subunit RPC12/RpoP